jgi:hypothetical protein
VQVKKVFEMPDALKQSNVQVKCYGRKSRLTHEDERSMKLSPIASWYL